MNHRARFLAAVFFGLALAAAQAAEAPDVAAPKKDTEGNPDARFVKRHEGFVAEAKKGGVDLLLAGDFLIDD